MKRAFGVLAVYLLTAPLMPIYLAWCVLQGAADGLKWCFEDRWLFRRWIAMCERAANRLGVGDIF